MDPNHFTPSKFNNIFDSIINPLTMYLSAKTVHNDNKRSREDYLLSPIRTPSKILLQYPKHYLLICENDALYDENMYFLHLLL